MIEEVCKMADHNGSIVRKQEQMQGCLHHGGEHKENELSVIEKEGKSIASKGFVTKGALANSLGIDDGNYMKIMEMLKSLVKTKDNIEACTSKLKDMMVECICDEGEDVNEETKLSMLNVEGIKEEYTTIEEDWIGIEVEDSFCGAEIERSLFSAEQGTCLWTCGDSAWCMDFKAADLRVWTRNTGPLAGMISKRCYYEEESSYWWQLDLKLDDGNSTTSSKITYVLIKCHLRIMLGRYGMKYLASIMQNFIFDPGGSKVQLYEHGFEELTQLAKDLLKLSMFFFYVFICVNNSNYGSWGRLLNFDP